MYAFQCNECKSKLVWLSLQILKLEKNGMRNMTRVSYSNLFNFMNILQFLQQLPIAIKYNIQQRGRLPISYCTVRRRDYSRQTKSTLLQKNQCQNLLNSTRKLLTGISKKYNHGRIVKVRAYILLVIVDSPSCSVIGGSQWAEYRSHQHMDSSCYWTTMKRTVTSKVITSGFTQELHCRIDTVVTQ